MITRHEVEQRSNEWFALRCGRITASNFHKALAKPGVTRTEYLRELAGDYVSGEITPSKPTGPMQIGIDLEPAAAAMYAFIRSVDVQDGGFYTRDDLPRSGASPDGIVGDGVLEIKVPTKKVLVGYLQKPDQVPAKYRLQILGHLAFTNSRWCDFFAYSQWAKLNHVLVRVERKEVENEIEELIAGLHKAENDLQKIISTIGK